MSETTESLRKATMHKTIGAALIALGGGSIYYSVTCPVTVAIQVGASMFWGGLVIFGAGVLTLAISKAPNAQ